MAEQSPADRATPHEKELEEFGQEPPSSFRVKPIVFGTKIVSICMQNENGPCPLLAICNALLLKGEMFIHPDQSFVSLDELLTQLTTVILKSRPIQFSNPGEQQNYEANIAASISTFNELSRGLDVNVRYSGVFAFEFTVQSAIFDLVNVPLCHGWLPDPTHEACSLVKFSSYNQLAELIIKGNEALDKIAGIAEAPEEPVASSSFSPPSSSSAPVAESSAPPHSQSNDLFSETLSAADVTYETTEQSLLAIRHGQLVSKWMEETASQLTFHGITKLYEELKEGQLYVFFRNNHFSTILMREASLWILITDQGYTKQAAVWEKLDSVHGDSFFVTSEFTPYTGSAVDYASLPDAPHLAMQRQLESTSFDDPATSMDEQLARQLQEAEHRRAKAGAKDSEPPQPSKKKRAKLTQSHQPQHSSKPQGRSINQSAPGSGRAVPVSGKSGKGSSSKEKPGKEDEDCVIL